MLETSIQHVDMLDITHYGHYNARFGHTSTVSTPMKNASKEHISLGNALFTSTQQRVLAWLFGQPDRSFFANELINLTAAGSGAVQRELKRLGDSGLVTVQRRGNQKHFQANPAAPIFAELCGIVQKTFGLASPLRQALEPLTDQIDAAFIYGSVAKQSDTASSDIDLLILSENLSYADVMSALATVESRLGRRINPTLYTKAEFNRRILEDNAFVTRVLAQQKIWLKGSEHDLTV
jgi:predicted nucleotidyltransferase